MAGISTARPITVEEARDLARSLLAGRPERWQHTVGVVCRAAALAVTVGADDPAVLLAAAWLHDIGYGEPVVDTGFHPLDGARYLDRHGWSPRVSALVAHHSAAEVVAAARGLSTALGAYPREDSAVSDALTYADQTVGVGGRRVNIGDRMAEMLTRHGPDSANARVHHLREPRLLAAAHRVQLRLADACRPR